MCATCSQPRLLPGNVAVAHAYLACSTQWRYAASGHRVGMDYPGVEAALRLQGVTRERKRRRLFQGIRVIEGALLAAQHEAWEERRASQPGALHDR